MIMYCDFRFYHTLFTLQKNEFLSGSMAILYEDALVLALVTKND